MDGFTITLWALRLAFVALIYLFFFFIGRALWRDIRATVVATGRELGRLVVLESPDGRPPAGSVIPLDAVNTIGRDVNNSIVIDDTFASAEHSLLTFRGRAWYVEDRGSTNGTWLNGHRLGGIAALGFGDEIQVGRVRLRLDRARAA